jgi:hypothetical protein
MSNSIKIIWLVFIIAFCFYQTSFANDKYLVTASALNVRDTASANSIVLGKLSKNDTVYVIDKTNSNWIKIEYEGRNGYVSAKYIKPLNEKHQTAITDSENYKVYLLIFGVIVLLGIILGYTKTIVVYRDFADLAKVFLLVLIPIIVLLFVPDNIENQHHKDLIIYGILAFIGLMFIWIIISTYKDNRNIIWTVIALCVKLPLAIIFLAYLNSFFSSNKDKSMQEQIKEKISAGVVLLFILGLVRHKVWRFKPNRIEPENNIYNQLDYKVQNLKQNIEKSKLK